LEFLFCPNSDNLIVQLENENLFDLSEDLFNLKIILFNNFVPLYLCKKVHIIVFDIIRREPTLKKYIEPIERATCKKLISQVSFMYKTITYSRLQRMLFKHWPQEKIENLVMELGQKKDIWCCMSQSEGILDFTPPNRLERCFFLKNHLAKLSNSLNNVYGFIYNQTTNLDQIRKTIFSEMRQTLKKDLENIQKKQQVIKNIRHQEESRRKKKMHSWRKDVKKKLLEKEDSKLISRKYFMFE